MKKIYFTILFLCTCTNLFAQETNKITITGTIIDSAKNLALDYVTMSVVEADSKNPVKSSLSKSDGSFSIGDLPVKSYILIATSIGYQTKNIDLKDIKPIHNTIDAGRIMLSPSNGNLSEVQISAVKPLIKQEIDRLSYDVQADPESKAQSVMELLRKVPLITVDGDNNIQLDGSSSYRIFINGKPSALLTNNPKEVLRSMPAVNVQRIEVITTPPAKYDAEGLAGIINIITTKTTQDGYNGTITAEENNIWGPNVNLNATFKSGKFGFSGYVGINPQPASSYNASNFRQTINQPSTYNQSEVITISGQYNFGNAEFSYEADSLNLFSGSLNISENEYNDSYKAFTRFESNTQHVLYNLNSHNNTLLKNTDLRFNYQLGFKHNKQELLTVSYEYQDLSDKELNKVAAFDRVNYFNPDYNQQNHAGTKEHTVQLDYIKPMKSFIVEAGGKAILRANFSAGETDDLQNIKGEIFSVNDPALANDFTYHRNVYSLYNSYTYKSNDWTIKGGARLEHTHIDANFITDNSAINNEYTNIVPSLSIMHAFKKNRSLTLGYTNRLQRPGIAQLNPFVNQINPQIITTGDPNLRPVISNLIQLSYTSQGKGTLTNRISYYYAGNSIVSVTRLISDSLSQSSFANAGKTRQLRWNIIGDYPLGPKFNVNFNGLIFYLWISGEYNGRFYSNKGPGVNSSVSLNYRPGNDWVFGATGGFIRRAVLLQGRSNDYGYSSFSVSKALLNKKLSFTALANNPFNKNYVWRRITDTPDFIQFSANNIVYQTFSISMSYAFGRLNGSIQKNQRGINNDDLNNATTKSSN